MFPALAAIGVAAAALVHPNISTLEAVWTGLGIAGLVFTCINLWWDRGDMVGLRQMEKRDRLMEAIAAGRIRRDVIRVFIQSAIIAIGGVAMTTPQVLDQAWTWRQIVFTGGLLTITVAASCLSFVDWLHRHKEMQLVREEDGDQQVGRPRPYRRRNRWD